jgi:hypothetical protein
VNEKQMSTPVEQLIGTIAGVRVHTYDTIYDMLVTTERVVLVLVEHPEDISTSSGVAELFLGRWLADKRDRAERAKLAENRRQAYRDMKLDEVLAGDRRNVQLLYGDIRSVRISEGLFGAEIVFRLMPNRSASHQPRLFLAKNQVHEANRLFGQAIPLKLARC